MGWSEEGPGDVLLAQILTLSSPRDIYSRTSYEVDGRRPSSRGERGRVESLSPDLFRRPENGGTNQIAVFKLPLSETRNTLCNTRSTLCNTTCVNVIHDE